MMGLKVSRNMMGLRGSPWKTPLLKENGSDFHDGVETIDLVLLKIFWI